MCQRARRSSIMIGLLSCVTTGIMSVSGTGLEVQTHDTEEIEFETTDGITIFGDLHRASPDMALPMVLLFHQGGSAARPEYGPIVGTVLDAGYHVLAIDQRRGGSRLGGRNRTVDALGREDFSYCEVLPDLAGALEYARARGFRGPKVLWGSSYSAALVFQIAAARPPDVAAVLAFSPASGEPMEGCRPEPFSSGIDIPVLVIRPSSEAAIESVDQQLATFRADAHEIYIAEPGVHGSSVLNPERVDGDVQPHWRVVLSFLARSLAAN